MIQKKLLTIRFSLGHMKKIGLVISLSLFSIAFASADNEGNIWYFGGFSGLGFNSGAPVSLNNSQMFIREGCATIADNNGWLLFYSDGGTIWSGNHIPMLNGIELLGNSSSTQSAIIVKKP